MQTLLIDKKANPCENLSWLFIYKSEGYSLFQCKKDRLIFNRFIEMLLQNQSGFIPLYQD